MSEIDIYWLFRAIYCSLGYKFNQKLKNASWQVAGRTKPKNCAICGYLVLEQDRSIDHIVPVSICVELEWYDLIYDEKNMRLVHQVCNWKRSSDISDLPEAQQEAIAIHRRLKTIAKP